MAPAFIYKSSTPFSSVHHNTLVRTPDWAMAGSQSCSELVPATFLPLSVGHPRGLHLREAFSLFSPGVEPPPPPTQEAPGPRVADRQHFCVSDVGEREREKLQITHVSVPGPRLVGVAGEGRGGSCSLDLHRSAFFCPDNTPTNAK